MNTEQQAHDMEHQPAIDTDKLRAMIAERQQGWAAARDLTDRYLEARERLARLESRHEAEMRRGKYSNNDYHAGVSPKQLRKRAEAQIEAARTEAKQIAEQRDFAAERAQNPALDNLIAYARRAGFVVDERRGIVRPRFEGEPQYAGVSA